MIRKESIKVSGFFVPRTENDAAIRGYVLRGLVRGAAYTRLATDMWSQLKKTHIASDLDFCRAVHYLAEMGFVEIMDGNTDAFHILETDAALRLSAKGILFVETGGNNESGIDL